jgi:amino acid adenylation domain-containing protein
MNPGVPLYNTVYTFDIANELNVDKFQHAFQMLVKSVDILRTVFDEEKGSPYQFILPTIEFELAVLDFTEESDDNSLNDCIHARSRQNFNLSDRLFDSALFKLNGKRFIWFLNIHHIVTDAISTTLLYKKIFEYYAHLVSGVQNEILPLPFFQSYLTYEEEHRLSGQNQVTQNYWKEKTEKIKTTPKLYGNENKKLKSASERVSLRLGVERSKKLRELSNNGAIRSLTPRITLFNLFATLLFAYLNRISGQKKLVIGAPAHNRPNQKFQKTPGLFIEIFPLVAELEDKDSFLSIMQRVKLETNDYLRHAQPGMVTTEISKSFNVVLNYMTSKFDSIDGLQVTSKWVHAGHCDPAHHMRCHVYDFDSTGNMEIHFDLNTEIFGNELRKNAPQHFSQLLNAMLDNIDQPITRPSIVTAQEVDILLARRTNTSENAVTPVKLFEAQAANASNTIAVRFNNEILTYQQLNAQSNKLANYLRGVGIAAGDIVSIHLERCPDYLISVLATMKLGATFVPISSDQPLERVSYILNDSKSKVVLTNNRQRKNISDKKISIVNLDTTFSQIKNEDDSNLFLDVRSDSIAYLIYTSGSTGKPKGVLISNSALANYLDWAKGAYALDEKMVFPLFTSIGFDLTITSTFLPLLNGGELIVYSENYNGHDISLMQVINDNLVNCIKLTPSHLYLLQVANVADSRLRLMIVGGEDFKTRLAASIQNAFGENLKIFNEYGPTEATVGCIVGRYETQSHKTSTVPIGNPIANMDAYLIDVYGNLVPKGVIGELYLSGSGLAEGYANLSALTEERFVQNPFNTGAKMYRTGDLGRINAKGEFEYMGRSDEQVKLNGFRIELSDIESNLTDYHAIDNSAVVLFENKIKVAESEIINCRDCGLPSSYPKIDFDDHNICHLCNSFKGYKEKTDKYFKKEDELQQLLASKKDANRKYDCLALLSGGKDSTYVLARLINMGLRVLAFTLDNGYISSQAKSNILNITEKLGVDHVYGETPHMNKIFIDSLHRHKNVCNGCFKTIYTLSTKVALENEIPFVVTGLSRGQFFETRLTEELFWDEPVHSSTIDDTILEARKLYHQEEDAVKKYLDTSMFSIDSTFEKVQYVDFFRYCDVSLTEMLRYLKEKADWVRPTDTGRSTNCLINQVGIHVHKKERGYSNYSFPYSWDVRLGHKNRDEALEEINEKIDVAEVEKIMDEIGYKRPEDDEVQNKLLVGYYTGKSHIPSADLELHLSKKLPQYMLPNSYKYLEEFPLTANGKVDKLALQRLTDIQSELDSNYVAPRNEIEELLERIWQEVLQLEKIGVHDNFVALGGHSLAAIRVTARINDELETIFPLNKVFELPTMAEYAVLIEETLVRLLEQQ